MHACYIIGLVAALLSSVSYVNISVICTGTDKTDREDRDTFYYDISEYCRAGAGGAAMAH
jgi:hypothetical protein